MSIEKRMSSSRTPAECYVKNEQQKINAFAKNFTHPQVDSGKNQEDEKRGGNDGWI